jgi:hypothetical protein
VTIQEATKAFQAEKLRLARETGDFSALDCRELYALCQQVVGPSEQYSAGFAALHTAMTFGRRGELVEWLALKGIWPASLR